MNRKPVTSPHGHESVAPRPVLRLALGHESPAADLRRVREGLTQSVSSGRGIELDLSATSVLSSPIVATILWARRSCAARNLPFSVIGQQGRTGRILRSCGLLDDRAGRAW